MHFAHQLKDSAQRVGGVQVVVHGSDETLTGLIRELHESGFGLVGLPILGSVFEESQLVAGDV